MKLLGRVLSFVLFVVIGYLVVHEAGMSVGMAEVIHERIIRLLRVFKRKKGKK